MRRVNLPSWSLIWPRLQLITVLFILLTASFSGLFFNKAYASDDYPSKWRDIAMDSVLDDWGEYNRECTSFAAWRLHSRNGFEMPFHDEAINWKSRAQNLGYTVDSNPKVGSIAWFSYDHVAWVESVSSTSVTLEDYNSNFDGMYREQTMITSAVNSFIHFKDVNNSSGTMTPGIVRSTSSGLLWKLRNSNSAGSANKIFYYGTTGDTPIFGDWDGL